jgi:hypothetical protein
MSEAAETESAKARRLGRSPAYPSFPIAKALDNVKALYAQEKEYAAPLASALKAFGYGPKSSGGRQALATMKYYGLVDVSGEGDGRRIKASDIALKILRDPREDETEKRRLIHQVAMTPTAHKLLHDEYRSGLASDGTVLHFLHGHGFNEAAARELLAEFKETASYIGLYEPSSALDKSLENGDKGGDKQLPKIAVGDKVQVTVGGVDMFPDGATVLGFTDDGAWVYTDQSDSAAKLEEVTLIEAATEPTAVERPSVPTHLLKAKRAQEQEANQTPKGARKAVFPINDGDVVLTFPEGISGAGLKSLKRYLEIFLDEQIDSAADKPN